MMKRRDFLKASALGSGAALIPEVADASESAPAANTAIRGADSFELDEATIADLQRDMVSGKRTARSITHDYIERIESLDRKGPGLRSVLEINPDALSIAADLDR